MRVNYELTATHSILED